MRYLVGLVLALLATFAFASPTQYVCWDGTLVRKPNKCPVIKVPLVCPDGTVVQQPVDCPPIYVCPDGSVTTVTAACPPPPVDPAPVTE